MYAYDLDIRFDAVQKIQFVVDAPGKKDHIFTPKQGFYFRIAVDGIIPVETQVFFIERAFGFCQASEVVVSNLRGEDSFFFKMG